MDFKLEYYFDSENPQLGKCYLVRDGVSQIGISIFKELNSYDVYRNYNLLHSGKKKVSVVNDLMSIELLKVHPSYQKKGMGKQLVKAIIEKAKEIKCDCVFVRAEPFPDSLMNLTELIQWYKKFGFIELKKISTTEQLMILVLR